MTRLYSIYLLVYYITMYLLFCIIIHNLLLQIKQIYVILRFATKKDLLTTMTISSAT